MISAQLQLFSTSKSTNHRLHKIFTVVLALILSLTLSFTSGSAFASASTSTSSANASFFNNTTAVVTTAAVGALGLGAILVGLLDNNNNSNPTSTTLTSTRAITNFFFTNPAAIGVIDEAAKTIAITVPFNTDVTNLTTTFTTTGASIKVNGVIQISNTTTNDFTNPVIYTVTAANGLIATYTVTVTTAPQTTFTLTYSDNNGNTKSYPNGSYYTAGATVTVLSNTDYSLSFTKPYCRNCIVAGWNTAADLSGTSYPINAGAKSTFIINTDTTLYAEWVKVGTIYGGGTVIDINTARSNPKNILIMANEDQIRDIGCDNNISMNTCWNFAWDTNSACEVNKICTETSALDGCYNIKNVSNQHDNYCTASNVKYTYPANRIDSGSSLYDGNIGGGSGNTYKIIQTLDGGDPSKGKAPAAEACTTYRNPGYGRTAHIDWYLPSQWELNKMYEYAKSRDLIRKPGTTFDALTGKPNFSCTPVTNGAQCFANDDYWSSTEYYWNPTEYTGYFAWNQSFHTGEQGVYYKGMNGSRVRAVRTINY